MEKRTNSAILPCDVRPQRRKTEKAELTADTPVTVLTDKEKYLLSQRYPKKDDEAMPGMLNKVSKSVAEL